MIVSQSGYYGILICLRSFRIFGLTGRVFFSSIVEGIEFNSSKVPNYVRKKERLGFTSQLHGFQGAEAYSLSPTFVFA
jgi:hypothetical protein